MTFSMLPLGGLAVVIFTAGMAITNKEIRDL